ncbi:MULTISPECIES: response regulator transcription factor [unclassified Flavobacterium]|uniref:response regulator transcription factor n=1 Tax=unclassified Flavobacterium TaxID=196869 RepID=UPI000F0C93E0|nr:MULTISPECIES: response regulator transcription factor [unclassified Flavobacterium]AYN02749.1 DNA-binding response regulator [Flavobacterium sp. 140616W15]AYN06489.1 DNA-binding response regulator [Flavobacterium sp. 140616W15]MCD0472957.1 response regulator transcription factor [Flavobacterium sp. EDS]
MKILIIEDEAGLREVVQQSLEKEKYIVETAYDYISGLDKLGAYDYDCILIDIMLPNGNGLDLLLEVKRQKKQSAVIIISAKDAVDDKVKGLNLGADDYLSKPFHLSELHARIKSAIRRNNYNGDNFITWKNVTLCPEQRTVTIDNNELILNRKEFDLLYYFIINPNRLINKTAIAEYVWGDHTDQADNLDFVYSQIKNLRKKLKDSNAEIDIQAVYGIGYKMN